MKKVLHVLTREDDELAEAIVVADREADGRTTVVELAVTEADYQHLLEATAGTAQIERRPTRVDAVFGGEVFAGPRR